MRDRFKRQQALINSATENQTVSQLMQVYYKDLYQQLVKTELDQEIFQDTFLNLTSSYKPTVAFKEQFCRLFGIIKMRYKLTDKEYSYYNLPLNAISEQA